MTEYVRLEDTEYIYEVLARHTKEDGTKWVWLKDADGGVSTWIDNDNWKPYEFPPKPKYQESWMNRHGTRIVILRDEEIEGIHVFAYRYEYPESDRVYIRSETDIEGWVKLSE